MKNRTVRGIAALTLGAALLLSACGDDTEDVTSTPGASATTPGAAPEETFATPTAEDVAALESVTWTGDAGSKPTLAFTAPLTVTTAVSRVVTEGTGEAPGEGGVVWVRAVTYDGSTAAELVGSASSWDAPQMLDLSTAPEGHPLAAILLGKTLGTQALYAAPVEKEDGTSVTALTALEIVAAPPTTTLEEGMPTATFDESGVPSITVQPGFAGPTELLTQVLVEGDGAVVEDGQTVTVNYSGWLQSTGEKFDSSWDRGETFDVAPIGSGAVIAGWDQGLVGQQVGSTVMLVIPSDLAYGPQGNASIPGGASLVFVVEIVAAT